VTAMSNLKRIAAFCAVVGLLIYPLVVGPFWAFRIGTGSIVLGLIALSLVSLYRFLGVVSFAQLAVAGIAAYAAAIADLSCGLQAPWAAAGVGLAGAVLTATVVGLLSVRSSGIYLLMLTLALALGFHAFALQNYALMGGFNGFSGIRPPRLGPLDLSSPLTFYYVALFTAAVCLILVGLFEPTELGIALRAVRDNPRRVASIGMHVGILRVVAFALAGVLAGVGGIANVWFQERISPGAVSLGPTIDVLVVAVLGGIGSPLGAFIGAFILRALQVLAVDLVGPERVNSLVGLVFLSVVAASPNGLLGIASGHLQRLRTIVLTRGVDATRVQTSVSKASQMK
jgi:branched-chain amino acid transport system permease protein